MPRQCLYLLHQIWIDAALRILLNLVVVLCYHAFLLIFPELLHHQALVDAPGSLSILCVGTPTEGPGLKLSLPLRMLHVQITS